MVVNSDKISNEPREDSRSIDDVEQLRKELINCPEYASWDEADQKLISQSNYVMKAFLETNLSSKRALQSAKKLFSWKLENKINSLKAESFPKELHSITFVTLVPSNCGGTPTLILRLCFPSPPKYLLPLVYQYVSWSVEKMIKIIDVNHCKPRLIIDCANSKIDLFIIKEIINILVFIYPPFIESLTFCNMDWKFKTIYTIIRTILPGFIRDLIAVSDHSVVNQLTTKTEDLPCYLGGSIYNCTYQEWVNCVSLKEFLELKGFNDKQIDESINYVTNVINKFGNDAPVKAIH
ncbi:uncharacterized protein LOC107371253 [Tetranychus urticae]|uniref:CRAL-TRIO domain-containing protein n=1 Tax=Tetranychus urticae TaxID=32264 RepID=T1JXK7_TETUR|nr:uncharacterized protein LOC107371253 [Tetranychus urticae]